jgi:hypothetical protein
MSAADAWPQTGRPADRTNPGRTPRIGREPSGAESPRRRPDVPPLPRYRDADPRRSDRVRAERRPTPDDSSNRSRGDVRRPASARGAAAAPGRRQVAAETGGSRLRGMVAVLAIFVVTLAGAAVDSFLGMGLDTVTLIALVGTSAAGTLLVRRRDVFSVVVCPPLVYVIVALVDVALAPSATLSLPTLATLLIRGFPAMGIATAVALVLGLVRVARRR